MKKEIKCNHKNMVYIGQQELPGTNRVFYLYNCKRCHTTVSFPEKIKIKHTAKKKSEIEII